jgi:LPS export ABC transporter protein LptC
MHQKEANEETNIRTNRLIYFPNTNEAYTDEFITFARFNYSISSIGFKAYLDKEEFILKEASGLYNNYYKK